MKYVISSLLALVMILTLATPTQAQEPAVLGIHILHPYELPQAEALLKTEQSDEWHYVTIPLSLNDLDKHDQWQEFFNQAREQKIVPIVRLVTRFEDGAWQVPTRKDIVDLMTFLERLNWPTPEKHVIVFNEPNHAHEWGGTINPAEYGQILTFTAQWAKATDASFVVLPAGMDLAAASTGSSLEAFSYLSQMIAAEPEALLLVDAWNSHSYPNPGFSSSPYRTSKNSLRGFEHELAYIKEKTGRDLEVFITETGWVENWSTRGRLAEYYEYAARNIWSDQRIKAVTPFLLQGSPGPFSGFSFLDEAGQPTLQYVVYRQVIEELFAEDIDQS